MQPCVALEHSTTLLLSMESYLQFVYRSFLLCWILTITTSLYYLQDGLWSNKSETSFFLTCIPCLFLGPSIDDKPSDYECNYSNFVIGMLVFFFKLMSD